MSYDLNCPGCGYRTDISSDFCPNCGRKLKEKNESKTESDEILGDVVNRFRGKRNKSSDILRLRDLVINVLKKHSTEETEEIFTAGLTKTTPPEWAICFSWQKPWLFSRVFAFLAFVFFILRVTVVNFSNSLMIPGTIFIGSLVVPLTLVIFFFEANAPRNISMINVSKLFFLGGCASLLLTLFLFSYVNISEQFSFIDAVLVGIIEEVGKLIVVALFISKLNSKYILNGILIGAAIGAGFSVFESAGYAFVFFVQTGFNLQVMFEIIYLRGFLASGGHIIWAAMSGAAICLIKKDKPFEFGMLFKMDFLKLFAVPVVLHSVWDMPINIFGNSFIIPLILTVIGWAFILTLVDKGLKQISGFATFTGDSA